MIRVFGSKLYVSVFTLLLIAVISISVDAVFFYIAVVSALMHELAHIVGLRLYNVSISRISVYPFGVAITADTSSLSYKREMLVAALGPIMSLLLSVVSFMFWNYAAGGIYLFAFFISNFIFFCVNIFPIKGLDGGRLLLSVLMMKLDIYVALRIYDFVSTAAFGLLCLASLAVLWASGYNLSLVFICAYLYISEYAKQKL